jgi:hypothetical protein
VFPAIDAGACAFAVTAKNPKIRTANATANPFRQFVFMFLILLRDFACWK